MASADPLVSMLERPGVRVEDVAILLAREAHPQLDEHTLRRALDGLGAEALIRRGLRSTQCVVVTRGTVRCTSRSIASFPRFARSSSSVRGSLE